MYGVDRSGNKNPMFKKYWTDEQKKRQSEILKGRCNGKNNPMYGKHHSKETLNKISNALIGNQNPRARAVRCIETNIKYNTAKEAKELTGINPTSICQCCRGIYKTAGGFRWKYDDCF